MYKQLPLFPETVMEQLKDEKLTDWANFVKTTKKATFDNSKIEQLTRPKQRKNRKTSPNGL